MLFNKKQNRTRRESDYDGNRVCFVSLTFCHAVFLPLLQLYDISHLNGEFAQKSEFWHESKIFYFCIDFSNSMNNLLVLSVVVQMHTAVSRPDR